MAPWDPLKMLIGSAETLAAPIIWIVLILSIALFAIAFLAYRKNKTKKLLFVCIAFFLFAVKFVLMALDLYVSPGKFFSVPIGNVFDLAIMLLLFAAIFRK